MADVGNQTILRRFLLGLAEGMNAAAETVDGIRDTMLAVSRAYGRDDTDIVVLPTAIIVQTGTAEEGRVALRSTLTPSFRFDQIAALYALLEQAKRAAIEPLEGIRRLNEIGAMRPRYGWVVRTFGHALLVTGLALLLTPTWQGALVAFVLGAFIGLAKLVRSPTLQLVFPVFAAFACALAVFLIAPYIEIGDRWRAALRRGQLPALLVAVDDLRLGPAGAVRRLCGPAGRPGPGRRDGERVRRRPRDD